MVPNLFPIPARVDKERKASVSQVPAVAVSGIPDIDADGGVGGPVAGPVETVVATQGDIPYTVISVREPLANLREETQRLLLEQHNSSQVSRAAFAACLA